MDIRNNNLHVIKHDLSNEFQESRTSQNDFSKSPYTREISNFMDLSTLHEKPSVTDTTCHKLSETAAASHYNMRLLADSAQQVSRQPQQYGQPSSSASDNMQQHPRDDNDVDQSEMKSSSPLHKRSTLQSRDYKSYNESFSPFQWNSSDIQPHRSSTSDFLMTSNSQRIHDVMYSSQNSPLVEISDYSKSDKRDLTTRGSRVDDVIKKAPTPELKSPLEQQKQERFFCVAPSNATTSQELDDEAPLNDRDKEAIGEIGALLETMDKPSIDGKGEKSVDGGHLTVDFPPAEIQILEESENSFSAGNKKLVGIFSKSTSPVANDNSYITTSNPMQSNQAATLMISSQYDQNRSFMDYQQGSNQSLSFNLNATIHNNNQMNAAKVLNDESGCNQPAPSKPSNYQRNHSVEPAAFSTGDMLASSQYTAPFAQTSHNNPLLTIATAATYIKSEISAPATTTGCEARGYQQTILPQNYPLMMQQQPVGMVQQQTDVTSNNLMTNNQYQQQAQMYLPNNFTNETETNKAAGHQVKTYQLPRKPTDDGLTVHLSTENPSVQFSYGSNNLAQLATIAVAAASREDMFSFNIDDSIPNTDFTQPADLSTNHPNEEGAGWLSSSRVPQASHEGEILPIRTNHDPFISPTNVINNATSYCGYGRANPVVNNITLNAASADNSSKNVTSSNTVTWQESTFSSNSYDDHDPLMQEAFDVADPSNILPNSMMGGTPTGGAFFRGSSRPMRQRHHSEGAHLIRSNLQGANLLKHILHNRNQQPEQEAAASLVNDDNFTSVPHKPPCAPYTTNLVTNSYNGQPDSIAAGSINNNQPQFVATTNTVAISTQVNLQQVATSNETKKESWAEPKPLNPRRIRRRRHSADCRLLMKQNKYPLYPDSNRSVKRLLHPCPEGRVRQKPPPLHIPQSVNSFASSVGPAILYQSNLHHRSSRRPSGESSTSGGGIYEKIPPYTPPPMLSPMRAGSGLYCKTPCTPYKLMRQASGSDSISSIITPIIEVDENKELQHATTPTTSVVDEMDIDFDDDNISIRSSEPKINLGGRFQAEIPNLVGGPCTSSNLSQLIWKPQPGNSRKIEEFLELACSAVVPYGGSNKEYALHCLLKCGGNILQAVEMLTKQWTPSRKRSCHNDVVYHFNGSGQPWSFEEIRLFEEGMRESRKDFFVISQKIKSRSTAECVERYYHVTKRNQGRLQTLRRAAGIVRINNFDEIVSYTSSSDVDHLQHLLPVQTNYGSPDSCHNYSNLRTHEQYKTVIQDRALNHIRARVSNPASPAGSPASMTSVDDQLNRAQDFPCPVCKKTFQKVKSRNAHMKTHGKQAQEKRRARQEEMKREAIRKQQITFHQHHHNIYPSILPPQSTNQQQVDVLAHYVNDNHT